MSDERAVAACEAGDREPSGDEAAWLARVLDVVRERTGLDFGGYRPATLVRRLRNRMIAAGEPTLHGYLERLRREPAEADALVEKLTIKVSRFFRDPATFEAVRRGLQERRAEARGGPLHVWSAGCGAGEEPYGLAILLAEIDSRGDDEVLATDIDPAALARAARGCYAESALEGVDHEKRVRYFEERPGAAGQAEYRVRPELRDRVTLRPHDLVGSASSPGARRFDLVCCRNVLIYLEAPTQARVESLLADSVLPGGLLCLGEAEWLLNHVAPVFDVVDRKARLFRRHGREEAA
jgi:chemotaxis methyl-accepting protein methylase